MSLEFLYGYLVGGLFMFLFAMYFLPWLNKKLNHHGLVEPFSFRLSFEEARIFYYLLQQRDSNEGSCYPGLIQDLSEYLSQYRSVESSGFNLW